MEPDAHVLTTPSTVKLQTTLGADWPNSLEATVGVAIGGADVYGMQFGKTEVVARSQNGRFSIDPVHATLNGGVVHLEPKIQCTDGKLAVLLGPESSLKNVEVNEKVSHRVLAFVAPVLDSATRVRGRISAEVEEATLPLGGQRLRGGDA